MGGKHWTQEELNFIEDKWGVDSVKSIAKNLGRTYAAVIAKAQLLGFGDPKFSVDGVSIPQLAKALKIATAIIYRHWMDHHDFPYKAKTLYRKKRIRFIDIEEFWKWAYKNQELIDFSRLEKNVLGKEPKWVDERRKKDCNNLEKRFKHPWSRNEDIQLIQLVKLQKYTALEIAKILGRSEPSVDKRCYQLRLYDRPVSVNERSIKWTPEQEKTALLLKDEGYGMNYIADKIGKSVKAVRTKYIRLKNNFKGVELHG